MHGETARTLSEQTTPAGPAPTTALNPKRLDSVLQRLENSENDTSSSISDSDSGC